MDLTLFKDFLRLSFLIDRTGYSEKNVALITVANCHKSYQSADDFKNLIESLIVLFPDDEELSQIQSIINEQYITDPKKLLTLQKKLKTYGIKIYFHTIGSPGKQFVDTFRKRKNKKLPACLHKTTIDKNILFDRLKDSGQIPEVDIIETTIKEKYNTITILNTLKNYDDWKLSNINKDTALKIGAATTGIIPIIPVYDLVRLGAYTKEGRYRTKNKKNMEHRIKVSFNLLEDQKSHLDQEIYNSIHSSLANAQQTKGRHIGIKIRKVKVMQGIHTTSAIIMPFSDIAGPIGSGSRSAVKGIAKITNSCLSVDSTVQS